MSDIIIKLTQHVKVEPNVYEDIEIFTVITAFWRRKDSEYTNLITPSLKKGDKIQVKETPEEILELLKEAENTVHLGWQRKVNESITIISSQIAQLAKNESLRLDVIDSIQSRLNSLQELVYDNLNIEGKDIKDETHSD